MNKLLFLLFFLLGLTANAQNIVRFEYFFDTDPGMGLGTQVSVTPSVSVTNFSLPISTASLPAGFHTLYIRSQNDLNQWTHTHFRSLYIVPALPSPNNITQIEYFIDTDPGVGLATAVTGLTPATSLTNFPIDISATPLSLGFHNLYVRAKTSAGQWTETYTGTFNVTGASSPPSITSFSPTSGIAGTSVTISGSNFSTTPANNIVTFNGKTATVTSSTATSISMTVPAGATSGIVRVNVGGLIATSSTDFNITAPNVVGAEYFFDTDPGTGSGTAISITPGTTVNVNNLNVPTTSLTLGWHLLCARVKDTNNVWSFYETRTIFVSSAVVGPPPPVPATVAMEYFFDTDPGFGSGTAIPITPGTTVNVNNLSVPTTTLSAGWHTLNVRSKDANNVWGFYETRTLYVSSGPVGPPPPVPNTVAMEYFFDTDLGLGSGTSISVTPGTTVNVNNLNVPTTSLSAGWHTFNVRSKDANNAWSFYETRTVYVSSAPVGPPPPVPNTVAMEYFFDTDPSLGSGLPVSITAGTTVSINPNLSPASSLSLGWHTLNLRSKDANNNWGFYETRTVFVSSPPQVVPLPSPIVAFEYFVDDDPGIGLSTLTFSKTPSTLIDLPAEPLNVPSLALGTHNIGLRAKDQNGNWSPTELRSFTVSAPCSLTATPTANNATRCTPGTLTHTAAGAIAGQTYRWYADNTTLVQLFTGNPFVTPSLSANTDYYVTIYNTSTFCESPRTKVSAIVTGLTKPVLNLTGSLAVCAGNTVTLSAPAGFAVYTWSNGLTTQNITITTSGAYTATVGDGNCTSPASDPFIFTVNAAPVKPTITSTGGGALCGTGSVTLSAPAGFSSYSWSSGQTTQSISVSSVGNFTVTVTNANGCQSPSSDPFAVTTAIPSKPAITVTGNTTLCGSSTVQLSAPAGFTNYTWSNGATTQNITVSTAGNYSVTVANGSCVSPASDAVNITSVTTPAKPIITVTGGTALCTGSFVVLNVPAGFSNYVWSTGETTRQIVVSTAGNFSVQVGNASNCLSVASDIVTTTATGAACTSQGQPSPPTVTGASRCGVGSVTLTASGAATGQVYRWYDVPTAGSILFTGSLFVTPSITVNTNYYASLYDAGAGTESNRAIATASIVILAAPTIAPNAAVNICAGSSTLLSAPVGFTNYVWSTGANTQQISVNTAGNYSVQTGDGTCLSPSSALVVVSISPALAKPTITASGGTVFCGTGSVQFSAPIGFQYAWSTGATSQTIAATTAGIYTVTVSNGICTSPASDALSVTSVAIPTKPVVTVTGSTTLCTNSFAALTAPVGFPFYLWSTGETTQQIIVSIAGNYTVQVGNSNNCLSSVSDAVAITQTGKPCTTTTPVIPLTTNASICGTGAATLTASGAEIGHTYNWYAVALGGAIIATTASYTTTSLSQTTDFYVSTFDPATAAESKRAKATVMVSQLPAKPIITVVGKEFICGGSVVALTAPTNFTSYKWSTGETTQTILVDKTGNYSVQTGMLSTCLSIASDQKEVKIGTPAQCGIIPSSTNIAPVIKESTFAVQIQSTASYPLLGLISDENSNLDISTLRILEQPIFNGKASGGRASLDSDNNLLLDYKGINFSGKENITIQVCDRDGSCTQQRMVVDVVGDVTVFNGITPDGDGINDFMLIQFIDILVGAKENKVTIFNRWGDIVFDIDNYNNTDRVFVGNSNSGALLPSGTYLYKVELVSKTYTGFITLKR
jgi:gliding motility-associated-like protein